MQTMEDLDNQVRPSRSIKETMINTYALFYGSTETMINTAAEMIQKDRRMIVGQLNTILNISVDSIHSIIG